MLRNPYSTFEHKYFYSMVDRDDPESIPNFWATNIENLIIRDRGKLQLRPGLTARGTNPNQTMLGRTVLYKSNGTRRIIRVINGAANTAKFQHSDDGITWTDSTSGGSKTTGARWSFVQANDAIYGVNGTDTPIKHDGTTVSTVSAIPQGNAIEWWKNHLWIFANPTYKDRLYFSNANDPETHGVSSYVNVNLGDSSNGIGIKGTAGSTGRLYIGKQRSVWYLTGTSSSDFAIAPLTYEHGVASHESMIPVGNDVWCIDIEGNIRSLYRTTEDNPFSALKSSEIQYTISGLNKASLSMATAVSFNNYAMFFVPNGVDTHNSLTLVWDDLCNNGKGGWQKYTNWRISYATEFIQSNTPKLFLFDSRTGNGQTYEWTGTSDNGQAIVGKYETKIYDFGMPMQEKRFVYSYQTAEAQGNYSYRFYTSIDRFYYSLISTPSLLGTGNKLLGVDWTLGTDKLGSGGGVKNKVFFTDNGGSNHGTTLQCKFELESSTQQLEVSKFTVHMLPYSLR